MVDLREKIYICGPPPARFSPASLLRYATSPSVGSSGIQKPPTFFPVGQKHWPNSPFRRLWVADKAASFQKQECSLPFWHPVTWSQTSQGLATPPARLSRETSQLPQPLPHPGILPAWREEAAYGSNHQITDSAFTWVAVHFGGSLRDLSTSCISVWVQNNSQARPWVKSNKRRLRGDGMREMAHLKIAHLGSVFFTCWDKQVQLSFRPYNGIWFLYLTSLSWSCGDPQGPSVATDPTPRGPPAPLLLQGCLTPLAVWWRILFWIHRIKYIGQQKVSIFYLCWNTVMGIVNKQPGDGVIIYVLLYSHVQ